MSHVSLLTLAVPIAAGLCALFLPFLHSEFILDDGHKIVENYDIRDWTLLPWSLFPQYAQGERDLSLQFKMNRNDPSRPLTFLLYTIEYGVAGGANPWIFRVVNVLLHGINGIMLYSVLNLLSSRLSATVLNVQNAAATLLWVFSPLNISTVNYAYSRSEILGFSLELCCLRVLLRGSNRQLLLGCVTLLALFAKQSYICIVPCVFVLFLLFPSLCASSLRASHSQTAAQKCHPSNAFYRSLPCFVSVGLYMTYRYLYLGGLGDLEADPANHPVPFLHYLRTQPFAIVSYILIACLGGMAVDHGVLVDDPVPILLPCLAIGVLLVVSCVFFCKNPVAFKAVAFGWAFALFHLAPTSLLVTTDVMADRRFYVASVPFSLLTCAVVRDVYIRVLGFQHHIYHPRNTQHTNHPQKSASHVPISFLLLGAFGLVLTFFGTVAYRHLLAYENNISAWRSVLSLYPGSVRAHNNLATSLMKTCRSCPPGSQYALESSCAAPLMGEALLHFHWLIHRDPHDCIALSNVGDILCSPTLSHANSVQNCSQAEHFLHRAVRSNPRFSSAAYNLALFYQRMNFLQDAEHWYLHAIAHNPHHALSHNNLGVLYMNAGRKSLALHYYKGGLAVDPDNQLIRSNMPSVRHARVLSLSEIQRVYEEPSVCNLAPVCISVQRSHSWGKLLSFPDSSTRNIPQQPQPSMSAGGGGGGAVNYASSFGSNVNLIGTTDDDEIPEHATPVQLRPEDYLQLLERALIDQPSNKHFRKLAMETCETLGRTECAQRHKRLLHTMHSGKSNASPAGVKVKRDLK